jgi:hypothetical protein
LTFSPSLLRRFAVSFSGQGSLTVQPRALLRFGAAFAGTSTLSVQVGARRGVPVSFSGTSTLTAGFAKAPRFTVGFQGSSALTLRLIGRSPLTEPQAQIVELMYSARISSSTPIGTLTPIVRRAVITDLEPAALVVPE